MSRLAFAAWILLAFDCGRVYQFLAGGDVACIAGGAALTATVFMPTARPRTAVADSFEACVRGA